LFRFWIDTAAWAGSIAAVPTAVVSLAVISLAFWGAAFERSGEAMADKTRAFG
jgi:hypothetical protein